MAWTEVQPVPLLSGREKDVVIVSGWSQSVCYSGALVLSWTATNGLLGRHVPDDYTAVILSAEREQIQIIGRESQL